MKQPTQQSLWDQSVVSNKLLASFHPTGLEEVRSMLSCLSNMTFPPADQLPGPQERQFPPTTEQ